ncbi:terminase large subunit domain-containing protein [Candidatus Pantoea persica]|uniref:terminase large subunit domain-containing protein n=1 Tax=Candidatus Pantoea persica TaxID=2518128 RepID=UPI00215DC452|nr:terminase family protein [Candidatus Pantoea persica]MBA2816371.1 phage terminase small subunit [Candidatus Pantoea persica]
MSKNVELYPYQQRWLLDRSRFKIGQFARQTGKTFTTTLELVDDCLETEARGGRTRWVILSRGERQAKEAMEEGVKKHCQAYGLAIREIEGSVKGPGSERYTMLEAVLPGGVLPHSRRTRIRRAALPPMYFSMSLPFMPTAAKSGRRCFR